MSMVCERPGAISSSSSGSTTNLDGW
jgi:hypothetical protein